MNALFILLGVIDIIAAAFIFFPLSPIAEALMMYIMVYMLAKGGFFLLTGLASHSIGPHCIILCISDILVGIALGVIAVGFGTLGTAGFVGLFLRIVGAIGVLKGIYTTVLPVLG